MKALALCSEKIPREAVEALTARGFEVVLLPPHPSLPKPVSCHADMIMNCFDGTAFFDKIYSGAYPAIIRKIKDAGCRVVVTEEPVGEKYPEDCRLNVAIGRRAALGHAAASPSLVRAIEDSGRVFIPVKQGYAACSTLIAEDALITADRGIAEAAEEYFDVMLIAPGNVSLEPYDTGFIGGASASHGKDAYFVGDLSTHPDGWAIEAHLASRGVRAVSLAGGPLTDVGGIKFIDIE